MKFFYQQGALDQLCGIYSIVNAYKILYPTASDCQELFDRVYGITKKKRVDTVREGVNHKIMSFIMSELTDVFPIQQSNKKWIETLDMWWGLELEWMSEPKRTIILSYDRAKQNDGHLTAIQSVTDNQMVIADSDKGRVIKKKSCGLKGNRPYKIYSAQCWYLGL